MRRGEIRRLRRANELGPFSLLITAWKGNVMVGLDGLGFVELSAEEARGRALELIRAAGLDRLAKPCASCAREELTLVVDQAAFLDLGHRGCAMARLLYELAVLAGGAEDAEHAGSAEPGSPGDVVDL